MITEETIIKSETGDGIERSPAPREPSDSVPHSYAAPDSTASVSDTAVSFSSRRFYLECTLFTLFAAAAFFLRFGCEFISLKLTITAAALGAASAQDVRTKTVPDRFSVIILVSSLIGLADLSSVPRIILRSLAVFIPLAIIKHVNPERTLGGADIKLISACACVSGPAVAALALAIALAASVIIICIIRKKKNEADKSYPLVPFITAGFLAASLI